jgi:hypothetical protein
VLAAVSNWFPCGCDPVITSENLAAQSINDRSSRYTSVRISIAVQRQIRCERTQRKFDTSATAPIRSFAVRRSQPIWRVFIRRSRPILLKNSIFGPGGRIFSPYRSISLFWQGDRPNPASRVARPRRVVWFTILDNFDRICGFDGNLGFPDFGVFQQNRPKAAVHLRHPLLRRGPSDPTFAAVAKSEVSGTHAMRDKASLRCNCINVCYRVRIKVFMKASKRAWLCCTNRVRDSCCESSVVAGGHEQTDPADL